MKKLLLLTTLFFTSMAVGQDRDLSLLQLGVQSEPVVLSDRVVDLQVDISSTKLKLSRADYSSPVVKVLVPELARETILDHRNTGEGAPCMATYDTLDPQAVIQDNPSVEIIPHRIVLTKVLYKDVENETCSVTLQEEIHAEIRGFQFTHFKFQNIGQRHIDDCM